MTRFFALSLSLALGLATLAQPAAAFSVGVDLPNLTFPQDGVTLSSKDCAAGAALCTAGTAQD